MQVTLNSKPLNLPEGLTVYEAIQYAKDSVPSPEIGELNDWIRNPSCPLLGLAEVDGKLVTLPALKKRNAKNGMQIVTDSPKVKTELAKRAKLLMEKHECYFMREWQKKIALEGQHAGFVTRDEYESYDYPERTARPSIIHDPNKCIRCQACVDVCIRQGVEALNFDDRDGVLIDEDRCVRCGQCITRCPMGAISYKNKLAELLGCGNCAFTRPNGAMHEVEETVKAWEILKDPELYCVAEFAPAARASLGEEFGMAPGELVTGKIYAALRQLGFKKVWDTNFGADLTIMEESAELIKRLGANESLPMFSSCCPGWIRFTERFYPDLINHLSSTKSPQQNFGAVAKTFGAKSLNVKPENMRVISFMPCPSKKTEAERPEMKGAAKYWQEQDGVKRNFQDIDLVLTVRELARLLKMKGIDLRTIHEEEADPLLGDYTGAGTIFGRTGGVMEAALRTVVATVTGSRPADLEFKYTQCAPGIKGAEIQLGDRTVKIAVVDGLEPAHRVYESIMAGEEFASYDFIEFMTCPGGCIGGGGQPLPTNKVVNKARAQGLNRDDKDSKIRMSHENPEIKDLYSEFLGKPMGPIAHELLHTSYKPNNKSKN